MRKADYQALANIVAKCQQMAPPVGVSRDEWRAGYLMARETIARDFARVASVDAPAFLKACGIDP